MSCGCDSCMAPEKGVKSMKVLSKLIDVPTDVLEAELERRRKERPVVTGVNIPANVLEACEDLLDEVEKNDFYWDMNEVVEVATATLKSAYGDHVIGWLEKH